MATSTLTVAPAPHASPLRRRSARVSSRAASGDDASARSRASRASPSAPPTATPQGRQRLRGADIGSPTGRLALPPRQGMEVRRRAPRDPACSRRRSAPRPARRRRWRKRRRTSARYGGDPNDNASSSAITSCPPRGFLRRACTSRRHGLRGRPLSTPTFAPLTSTLHVTSASPRSTAGAKPPARRRRRSTHRILRGRTSQSTRRARERRRHRSNHAPSRRRLNPRVSRGVGARWGGVFSRVPRDPRRIRVSLRAVPVLRRPRVRRRGEPAGKLADVGQGRP